MSATLQTVDVHLPIAAQATSDEGMVELWLRRHRNLNTKGAYAGDVRGFRAFVCGFQRKPPTYSNLMPPTVLT